MKAIRFALVSVLLSVCCASLAQAAQVQRTFVSGAGSDANPCSRTAPCRTFSAAIGQTNPGGEVVVLDSAGYGVFVIGKAVSIIAPPGVYAGISVFSGDGIDIVAGASDVVILRGLTVNSQGGDKGIAFMLGGTLHIENCVVNGFSTAGVAFDGGKLEVKDSIVRGNEMGIRIRSSSGTAIAAIDQVRLEGNIDGLYVEQGSEVSVSNSVASANNNGFFAVSTTSAATVLNIENCVASNNLFDGIVADSTSTGVATVRVSNSTVTDNGTGLKNDGSPALLLSRGNNTVEGNASNTAGPIGSYTAK